MTEPLTDVRQISHLAYGFLISKALFAALNIELFSYLSEGPASLSELADKSGVASNRLETLTSTLVSVGLLSRDGDRLANSPAAQRYLVPGAPAYFGDYYRFQIDRQIYPLMMGLDAGLAGDEAGLKHQSMSGWLSSSDAADDFSRAQHAGSTGPAMMLAKSIDLGQAETLLDVAGGTGAYSIALCEKHPDLQATIIDFPSVIDVAQRFIGDAGMAERIALIGGDALDVPWPKNQDVVLMSYLLSAVGGGDIGELFKRAWAALRPGGRLLLHDFMLDDDRSGPVSAAAFFMTYLALRTDPVSFTAAQVATWAAEHGFTDIHSDIMIPEITKIVTARKP